ncbi:MAG: tryptophan synthase subunit alpha [Candidatus Acididesulfobacter guangdongensis]|uniref:Tryptophan synthase alpha chain n=1 Tax=Acididesulfobacter guangdongensis TaxID=2597225 RepID=A0A519BID8_ACIG2|nr:MAG: tryptophan synthase subunit alpha [Candidatus Acididesulfobacter guangdongensis]
MANGINKIDELFANYKKAGKTAFIPFISIGDPDIETSFDIAKALISNGADMIELGYPFSDPMADGKVIQKSYERALKNRVTMADAFNFVARLREISEIPVIFFTYYNPIFAYRTSEFADSASAAGIDGVLVVDLPPEESVELKQFIDKKNIDQIFLLAPTSDMSRIKLITSYAKGFVYYVSVTGVTGARRSLPAEMRSKVEEIKNIKDIPVGIGFGISSPEQAEEIKNYADAIIIGSKIIQFIENNLNDKRNIIKSISEFSCGIKSSLM